LFPLSVDSNAPLGTLVDIAMGDAGRCGEEHVSRGIQRRLGRVLHHADDEADRHHLHRQTTLGYEGAMQMLTTLVNAVLERLDDETRGMQSTDYNYDLVR